MAFAAWVCRCLPGLSIFLLLLLGEWALQVLQAGLIGLYYPAFLIQRQTPVFAQILFCGYTLILHIISFAFTFRLSRAAWKARREIEKYHLQDDGGLSRVYSSDTTSSLVADDELEAGEPIMAILIPSYKEEQHVLEETLKVLSCHDLAKTGYDVFLAMEERDPNGIPMAKSLLNLFQSRFRDLQYTVHPGGLPGEAPGKSSNIKWAANAAENKYRGHSRAQDVLVTVMDSDTHFLPQYFQLIRHAHMTQRRQSSPTVDMTLYMPPIVFDRNAADVPCLVRAADLMWAGAGLSTFNTSSTGTTTISIPTAAYTLPLPLIRLVGGWDGGPAAIGEDMHMMLKCYFGTRGQLSVRCIPSPASQCNVEGPAMKAMGTWSVVTGLRRYIANHRARYVQALRHMWGSLDTGYTVSKGWQAATTRPSTFQLPPRAHDQSIEMIKKAELGAPLLSDSSASSSSSSTSSPAQRPRKLSRPPIPGDIPKSTSVATRLPFFRSMTLMLRIFEAHFLPAHLTLMIIFSTTYTNLPSPLVKSHLLAWTLDVTGYIRFISYIAMLSYFVFIQRKFQLTCTKARRQWRVRVLHQAHEGKEDTDPEDADLTSGYIPSPWKLQTWVDYAIFPVAGMLFGAIPLIQAAFAHFRGVDLVYRVSEKPGRKVQPVRAGTFGESVRGFEMLETKGATKRVEEQV